MHCNVIDKVADDIVPSENEPCWKCGHQMWIKF